LLVAVASAILLYSQGINLGLDLQGGVHLVLEVDVDEAIDEEINQMRDRVAADLEEQGIQLQNVSRSGSNIVISGVSQDSAGAVNDYLDQYNQAWEYQEQFQEGGLTYTLQMTGSYRRELGNQAVRQAREIVARRIDSH